MCERERLSVYVSVITVSFVSPSPLQLANSVTAVTISPANPPSLHPSPSSPSSSQLLPNGPIIANGTDTQVQGGSSALAGPGPHPLEEEEKRDKSVCVCAVCVCMCVCVCVCRLVAKRC